MSTQLTFLVKNSNDPEVAGHVINNLKYDPKGHDCRTVMLRCIVSESTQHLVQLSFKDPNFQKRYVEHPLWKTNTTELTGTAQKLMKRPEDFINTQKQLADMTMTALKKQQEGFAKLQQDLLRAHLKNYAKQQQMQLNEMNGILRDLMKLDDETLRLKLKDHNPLVCMLAAQVAGKKRLPVEKECIELLQNPNLPVRQAARQTLVRLGRSVDFRPRAGCEPATDRPVRSRLEQLAIRANRRTEGNDRARHAKVSGSSQ